MPRANVSGGARTVSPIDVVACGAVALLDGVIVAADHWNGRRSEHLHSRIRYSPDSKRLWSTHLAASPAMGRLVRRNPAGRCRLVRAGREALARCKPDCGDDAYRHSGGSQRESCRLDGTGQRRPVAGNAQTTDLQALRSPCNRYSSTLAPRRPGFPSPNASRLLTGTPHPSRTPNYTLRFSSTVLDGWKPAVAMLISPANPPSAKHRWASRSTTLAFMPASSTGASMNLQRKGSPHILRFWAMRWRTRSLTYCWI